MDEYIKREEAINAVRHAWAKGLEPTQYIEAIPAANVVEVVPELREAVIQLHEEYEKAKQLQFVRDPLAYALYQTWKDADGTSKNGR